MGDFALAVVLSAVRIGASELGNTEAGLRGCDDGGIDVSGKDGGAVLYAWFKKV